jgi:(p)ppGpp synthase/HD superfamily hydrolase
MIIDGSYSPNALKQISMCAAFAALAHSGQKRYTNHNGGPRVPYIVHPARVAGFVMQFGGEPIDVMCAWLHDVKEDCKGVDVDGFVRELEIPRIHQLRLITTINALTKDDEIEDRMERLDSHIDAIIECGSPGAFLVKICDRIDNLTITPYEDNQKRIEGMNGIQFVRLYIDESEHLYKRLTDHIHEEMCHYVTPCSGTGINPYVNPWGKCNVAMILLRKSLDHIKATHEAMK